MLITRLWKNQPGKFFCISTKSASKRWEDHFFRRGEWTEVEDFISDNADKDIYFCPHGFSRARRKEDCAVLPKMLWADLDEADPRESVIRPTIAIESSPGRYVGLWLLEETLPSKALNKRLTYFLGADHGGWDITQVLRVPGTTNYKYQSTPRVRTLWIDGPSYTVRKIEKLLPQAEEKGEESEQVLEVYARYEKSLPPWARRELLNGKPTPGKRSEMMWKLVNTLLESGVSRDDAFILLSASPWNKFSDEQLHREIEKSNGNKLKPKKKKSAARPEYKFLAHSLEDVEAANIDWIWYPYIARSELTIVEGDPSVGKSYMVQMMCAAIADGKRLPCVKKGMSKVQGKIAYFDLENDPGTVTKKRLVTNGCKNLADYIQEAEPFSIDNEDKVEEVEDAIERIKPAVVVFDTLNTYIGGADTHKASEATQAISWFKLLAKRFNCSVVVLRHLTKGSRDGKALYRGQGSIAFAGMARVVMSVGTMPDDPEVRVMAITKINVARPPKALTFTITALPDTLKENDRSKFEWGEFVDISADEFIGAVPKIGEKSVSEGDDAAKFLREELFRGGVEWKKLEARAEARSISVKALSRAADSLGVRKTVRGFGKDKRAMWSMPEDSQ